MAQLIAGVDEVGRGPLVGDVVTAAVILNPNKPIDGLNDSKKLSEKNRSRLCKQIKQDALAWAIGRATPSEIDHLNILHATMLAMHRAVDALSSIPDFVRVDGNRLPNWSYQCEAVVKGDSLFEEISAASIIAKVTRDEEMLALDEIHPQYGFAKHKGYPTKQHLQAIQKYGIISQHRKSFKPIQNAINGI